MTGGLIQLITTGIQDSPITGNPEITFFKTVYKQHTQFSLCQSDRFIGNLEFDKEATKNIEKNGDLLYSQFFKLEIPYFEIIKTFTNTNQVNTDYNINQLSVTYMNDYCIVFITKTNNSWYIVPETLFSLSSFKNSLTNIESSLITPNLLPDYIKTSDLGSNVNYYQIQDNDISTIISLLRVNSNFWEQFWLDYTSSTDNINLLNTLFTLKSEYNSVYGLIKYRMFNLYYARNTQKKNIDNYYLTFSSSDKTETERYFEYVNSFDQTILSLDNFDIDTTYKYCLTNFLNFNDYRDNILPNNSLLFFLMLQMLYSTNNLIYTFWKKYEVTNGNQINSNININITNASNEWTENLNNFLITTFNTTIINNIIFREFIKVYSITEQQINNIFFQLTFNNVTSLYINLKTILSRFNDVPNYQLNFNNTYLATKYTNPSPDPSSDPNPITSSYNNDNFEYLQNIEINKYPTLLKTELDFTNEMNNLTPIDLQNVYGLIANDVVNLELALLNSDRSRGLISFLVLWRNTVMNRLYKNFLDIRHHVMNNNELLNYNTTRQLTLYHTINPSNLYFLSEFKNSFYEMFYKNSWIGNVSIDNNLLLKLKENIIHIEINNLSDSTFTPSNNNFNKLSISNTYTYVYYNNIEPTDNYNKNNLKQVIYDSVANNLYVKYDNFYDLNSSITLYINTSLGTSTLLNTDSSYQVSFTTCNYQNTFNGKQSNSLYLVFGGLSITAILDNYIITLDVKYNTYLPLVSFYKPSFDMINITSTKYYILTKFSDNNIDTFNIVQNTNTINIDSSLITNGLNKIKILTINYLNSSNIVIPINFNVRLITSSSNQINIKNHLYCISYYTINGESDVSNSQLIQVTIGNIVELYNLPISENNFVIGRRIYRTKSSSNTFYLLAQIDNTSTTFIDDITDEKLGIEYNINNVTKLATLPNVSTSIQKTLINLKQNNTNDTSYTMLDMNGKPIQLPVIYDNIYEIYIEVFDFEYPYELISNTSFDINYNGQVILNNIVYSPDYLYYLVNPNNFMDYCKLVSSNNYISYSTDPFTLSSSSEELGLDPGTYTYKISYYNTNTLIETLYSESVIITLTGIGTSTVLITNLSPIYDVKYNSWKIYRTKKNSTTFYYLTTLVKTIDNQFSDNIIDVNLTIQLICKCSV